MLIFLWLHWFSMIANETDGSAKEKKRNKITRIGNERKNMSTDLVEIRIIYDKVPMLWASVDQQIR